MEPRYDGVRTLSRGIGKRTSQPRAPASARGSCGSEEEMVIIHAVTRSRARTTERRRHVLYIHCAYVLRYIYDPRFLRSVCGGDVSPWPIANSCCNSNASLTYRDRLAVLASAMVRSRRVSCACSRLCAAYRLCLDASTRLYAARRTPRPPSLNLGCARITSRIL